MALMNSHSPKRRAFRYAIFAVFVPVFFVGLVITLGSVLTLFRGGEIQSLNGLVQELSVGPRLYNSPSRDNRAFKLALVDAKAPKVIVVGSSRAMLFRDTLFKGDFVNAGGAVGELAALIGFLKALESRSGLELVLLQLDYWWFDNDLVDWVPEVPAYRSGRAKYFWGVNLMAPAFVWLGDGTLSGVRTLWAGATAQLPMDAGSIVKPLGFTARANGTGYAADGSFYYGASLYCTHRDPEARRAFTQRDGLNRAREFAPRRAWPAGVAALARAIEALEARGVSVISFTMPLAPSLDASLKEHAAFGEIGQELASQIPRFVDLHDPSIFEGLEDSGFIDAVHPGEPVYAKTLGILSARFPELMAGFTIAADGNDSTDLNRVVPESGVVGAAFRDADTRNDPHLAAICRGGF